MYAMFAMYACLSLSREAVLRGHGRIFNALHSVRAQTVVMSVRLVMSCCSVQMDSVQQQIRAAPADADLPFDGKRFRLCVCARAARVLLLAGPA